MANYLLIQIQILFKSRCETSSVKPISFKTTFSYNNLALFSRRFIWSKSTIHKIVFTSLITSNSNQCSKLCITDSTYVLNLCRQPFILWQSFSKKRLYRNEDTSKRHICYRMYAYSRIIESVCCNLIKWNHLMTCLFIEGRRIQLFILIFIM